MKPSYSPERERSNCPSHRAVVIEANEVPPRIFQKYASLNPASHIATLLRESRLIVTEADDVPEDFLYPSQTWASLNTGAPYDRHRIRWYNDKKPANYPMYWRILASRGYSVGLVNSLHTSPVEDLINHERVKFLIPEVFCASSLTKPAKYQPFQKLNQELSNKSRRVAATSPGLREALMALRLPALGVKPRTLLDITRVAAQVAAKRVSRERLRAVQFMLIADMFAKLARQTSPDLAILYTNHVASNMHRYWYALFPEEGVDGAYGNEWVNRYNQEIVFALGLFDSFIGEMMEYCRSTGRILIVNSSMGQCANPELDTSATAQYVIDDVARFLAALGVPEHEYKVRSAMEPQYSLEFKSPANAQRAFRTLTASGIKPNLNDHVLTFTIWDGWVHRRSGALAETATIEDMGLKSIEIDDHHSARHHPDGTLIIYNANTPANQHQSRISYLEFAPAILELFEVPRPDYMIRPSFVLYPESSRRESR